LALAQHCPSLFEAVAPPSGKKSARRSTKAAKIQPLTDRVCGLRGIPARADTPIALTIGNFDGVHLGHRAMIARLSERRSRAACRLR